MHAFVLIGARTAAWLHILPIIVSPRDIGTIHQASAEVFWVGFY